MGSKLGVVRLVLLKQGMECLEPFLMEEKILDMEALGQAVVT